jgi:hypothetical protein
VELYEFEIQGLLRLGATGTPRLLYVETLIRQMDAAGSRGAMRSSRPAEYFALAVTASK